MRIAKKQSTNVVDVITAEDIGKMPDENVADSQSRVPGVTVSSPGTTADQLAGEIRAALQSGASAVAGTVTPPAAAPAPAPPRTGRTVIEQSPRAG